MENRGGLSSNPCQWKKMKWIMVLQWLQLLLCEVVFPLNADANIDDDWSSTLIYHDHFPLYCFRMWIPLYVTSSLAFSSPPQLTPTHFEWQRCILQLPPNIIHSAAETQNMLALLVMRSRWHAYNELLFTQKPMHFFSKRSTARFPLKKYTANAEVIRVQGNANAILFFVVERGTSRGASALATLLFDTLPEH